MSFDDFAKETEDLAAWATMVKERIPGIGPMIDAKLAEVAEEIAATFQPFIDLGEGRITEEEFQRLMAERREAEDERRRDKWGEPDDDGEWVVQCEESDCLRPDEELVFDELPPLYATHEDVDGISCLPEEEDEP